MPLYEYECIACGELFELLQSQSVSRTKCPDCGGRAYKAVSTCAFKFGNAERRKKMRDKSLRQYDMKADLKERYGVEEVAPLTTSRGRETLESVYSDVVSRGSMIKDQMQETAGRNAEKTKTKQKKWLEEAWARRPQRIKELKAQQEKEKVAERQKNAITVSTKKK